jgi:Chaperone of endosialidase
VCFDHVVRITVDANYRTLRTGVNSRHGDACCSLRASHFSLAKLVKIVLDSASMNPSIKISIPSFSIAQILALICIVGLVPKAQAVSPPPDGGYPGANTAEGQRALLSLTTGGFNTAIGYLSLRNNAVGSFNTAVGAGALVANTSDENTAVGLGALLSHSTGSANTANGAFALFSDTAGQANTAIGDRALVNNTNGNLNVALGFDAGALVTTANNVICIGSTGSNVNNSCFIGNIAAVDQGGPAAAVFINVGTGQLGTAAPSSSRRFKREIKAMDKASEAILGLKPVTFEYKSDKTNTAQFGLIAEEVAEVNPNLVVRDKNGEIYTVRYDAVNAMLLNEFLKEHRKVQKLEATVAQQHKDFETAVAELKGQIQKVSAQLEVSKPAPQTVLNGQ